MLVQCTRVTTVAFVIMADLDDFFAKKDKKKKGKGKYASKTPKSLTESSATSETHSTKDVKMDIPSAQSKDDEWIEETEVVEDLEGLKVAALKVQQSSETPAAQTESVEQTDRDDMCEPSEDNVQKQVSSPWQPVTGQSSETVEDYEEEEQKEDATPTPQAETASKYVPPNLRSKATPTTSVPSRPRKNYAPPDIQNTQTFPTLQASTRDTTTTQDKDFTQVKPSKKASRPAETNYAVELTNKFSSLS